MRIFYERWSSELNPIRQLVTDELDDSPQIVNRQLLTDDFDGIAYNDEISSIHQLPTGESNKTKISAFFRVGFTHHIEILTKCKNIDERWYYILRCADEFWSVAS